MNINFQENVGHGFGTLLINGLTISHNGYDPLGKIWASARRRVREKWHVDVVGLFTYNDEKGVISCNFHLSYCATEMGSINEKLYSERYKDSFPHQMAFFEDILLAFVDDQENGLSAYEQLYPEHTNDRELDRLIDRFLCSINVRTKREQKRSDERHAAANKK